MPPGGLNATTGIFTDQNPPANLLGMGYENPNGALELAADAGYQAGGTTIISQPLNLSAAQALQSSFGVVANVLYAIEDIAWNAGSGDNLVAVHGLGGAEYAPVGYGVVGGTWQLVSVDVAAGTYVPFAGGAVGTPRDPLAVGDVLSIADAVADPSNTWTAGDLTAYGSPALQDAGAPPAVAGQNGSVLVGSADVATMDEFDRLDAGGAWRYRYSRRNDGTSGWTRTPKG